MTSLSEHCVVAVDLTYRYPSSSRPAIGNVNLSVEQGDFLALIGRSGCGKSTLLRCLTGLIPQASEGHMQGKVEICGLDTRFHALSELATLTNMVFQDPEIGFFCSTVEAEIAFGPTNLGLSDDEIERRVNFGLKSAGIEHLRHRRVVDLSGGEKQRTAIASVLSMKPKILALDEPTSDLDLAGVHSTVEILQSLRTQQGMTVIVAEHRLDPLAQYLNRVVVMQRGHIVADDSPDEILNEHRGLLEGLGILPPHLVPRMPACSSVEPEVQEAHLRSPLVSQIGCSGLCELKRELRDQEAILHVDRVAFNYPGGPRVLRDVSFEMSRGEMVALFGPNGAGKTTLAHLIAGLLKPSKGNIVLDGTQKPRGNIPKRVGLLFQNPSRQLFCGSVRQEVEFGPKNSGYPDFAKRAEETLQLFGLERHVHTDPHHLSEGEKQRLATASILASRPQMLILDEPTTGQDWGHLKALMGQLQVLVREGMGVLLITHDVHLVNQYATRLMIMRHGTIAADGPVTELLPQVGELKPAILQNRGIGG